MYDVFGHVCRAGTYVPNSRIRDMLHYNPPQETVQYLADCFARGLQYADTYKPIAYGSETMLIDPNLQFVWNCLVVNHGENRCAVTKLVTSGSVLCKKSHGEHCISTMPGRTKQKVYPFRVGDEQRRQLAEERHNLFFGKAIGDWLNSPTERFGEFMLNNGQEIVEEIFQTANEEI